MDVIIYPIDIKQCITDAFKKDKLLDVLCNIGEQSYTLSLVSYKAIDSDLLYTTLTNAFKLIEKEQALFRELYIAKFCSTTLLDYYHNTNSFTLLLYKYKRGYLSEKINELTLTATDILFKD